MNTAKFLLLFSWSVIPNMDGVMAQFMAVNNVSDNSESKEELKNEESIFWTLFDSAISMSFPNSKRIVTQNNHELKRSAILGQTKKRRNLIRIKSIWEDDNDQFSHHQKLEKTINYVRKRNPKPRTAHNVLNI
jgi:hypothetical protein